ncbi:WD repeat-containing protein 7, partial [Diaphorina citri]|uniref:WD repeat-containing protein 7 n=1 Tax=Diaphorina citri TaxID=121845 RepID=A0A3Q0JCW2_DIACI
MSNSTNLVVPVVLWGKTPLTHCISCIYLSEDQHTLITGCHDGQICLWQVEPDTFKMTPRCLLVGHTAPILCMAKASIIQDNNFIVTSSESGEMCTWDLVDGKCRESVKLAYVHTSMQPYQMNSCEDIRLFCNGCYAEVLIMDPFSLEIIFSLSSKVNPDWISALYVLRPNKRKDDVVLALTTTATVKVWTLNGTETKQSEPIYEHESKPIRCLNALAISCCATLQRTVLIVCAKYWQIYDASDFSVLCTVISHRGERWLGGEFLALDRILVWTDEGKAYLYKLPSNSVADNLDFHKPSSDLDTPYLYCICVVNQITKPLSCPPAFRFFTQPNVGKFLLRGDSEGRVVVWQIPEVTSERLASLRASPAPLSQEPLKVTSLAENWAAVKPPPVGILDQLDSHDEPPIKLTSSIYLPQHSRLVLGREDGSIIIVPATQTVMLQLLHGSHQQYDDWPPHQLLVGHQGRVNCLLYPNHVHPRYERSHLLSGGEDFAVCLWDLYAGTLLHRFCVHAGEITQLLVPPNTCSPRILKCICSVASDHSVTLLSLAERKCVVLASRHLFPVTNIKWRPLDDFMIIGCSDGTVYVWQMETGHLDRVLHGMNAEDVLNACDENTSSGVGGGEGMGLANPAVHLLRGLRSRNISAIRHATQRGIHQLQQLHHHSHQDGHELNKSRAFPLLIQGLRTNPKDPESHILCFDIEALIVQLLSEEYSVMSPGTLEAQGLINSTEYQKVAALTQSASPDAHKKIAGIIAKMKEGAETVHTRLQQKAEMAGLRLNTGDGKVGGNGEMSRTKICEANLTMEIAQLLLSLLHAWGLDPDLDKVCEGKLGLLRPMVPVSFGVVSKAGHMSLMLPTWQLCVERKEQFSTALPVDSSLPPELVALERLTRQFTAQTHWELSTSLTTNHLISIISLSSTLMSMNNASFVAEQERNRKLQRGQSFRNTANTLQKDEAVEEIMTAQQAQIKQGWSLLATLHCILLPDKVIQAGGRNFKRPQVEMMARRWQHHCLEVREAAQALLLAELGRIGSKGRKALVDYWAQYLPVFQPSETANTGTTGSNSQTPQSTGPAQSPDQMPVSHEDEEDEEEEGVEEFSFRKPSSASELKRKQTTAVVLMGVIGAEFGQDVSLDTKHPHLQARGTHR